MRDKLMRTTVGDEKTHAVKMLGSLKPQMTKLLEDLIRVNTVAIPPDGDETPGQLVLQRFFKENGLRPQLYETEFVAASKSPWRRRERNYKGRKNLGVRLSGSGGGRSLLLSGHMDTVPTDVPGWKHSPWEPSLKRGRMSGLGTFDMKGGLVAQAAVLVALKRAGIRLKGDLLFESVVDEEWGGGNGTLAGRMRGDNADACVIAEGTQMEIYRATRGSFVVDLLVQAGSEKDYFSSGEVVSPAIPMGRLLGWVDSWVQRRKSVKSRGAYSKFSDAAPVQVLAVEANRMENLLPLSVPLRAGIRVYFQFLPHEDLPTITAQIEASLRRFERGDPFFRKYPVNWKPLLESPLLGHELSASHAWTKCMVESVGQVMGAATLTAAPYPCDAFLMQRAYNIPTLVFGPCGGGAHNPNEYVEMKSLFQSSEAMLVAALKWCGS
jgi:acetylornithine deacetylase